MTYVKPTHYGKPPIWRKKRLERLQRLKRYYLIKLREINDEIAQLRGGENGENA